MPQTTLQPGETRARDGHPKAARREQLRLAKRRQREREKQRDLATYQLRIPRRIAEKLKAGNKQAPFAAALQEFIDQQVICIGDYDNLQLLAWNRSGRFITRAEAFQLYERNWRHVDLNGMGASERELIAQLAREYGNGVINA